MGRAMGVKEGGNGGVRRARGMTSWDTEIQKAVGWLYIGWHMV